MTTNNWVEFDKLTDRYKKWAGDWHNEECRFPEVDAAVCNCSLPKNKKVIKHFLIELLQKHDEELVEKLRRQLLSLYHGTDTETITFNEGISTAITIITNHNKK